MPVPRRPVAASRNVGSQTLARGLRALELVAGSEDGLSIQEVAEALSVHRTIAYRVLSTLADFRFVTRSADGRYRAGAGLTALGERVLTAVRGSAEPFLRELAKELGSTVALIVEEGEEAVAISVTEPPSSTYHLAFRAGSRHPLDQGAAGVALLAARPPRPAERHEVTEARERGYASTFGEVEPGAYGIAAPLRLAEGLPGACVNVITYRGDVAERAVPAVLQAAARIADAVS